MTTLDNMPVPQLQKDSSDWGMDDETLQMLTSEEWEYKLEQPQELSGGQAQPAGGMAHLVVPANAIAMSMEGATQVVLWLDLHGVLALPALLDD